MPQHEIPEIIDIPMPSTPIEVGDKVVYRGGETHQQGATIGIYPLHDTDDYVMCGYVEIKDALGRIFAVDASLLERAPAAGS